MSPPQLDLDGGGTHVSSVSLDCISQTGPCLKERNYLGLSDCSSVDSSSILEGNKNSLNLKATELRLGLPGSQSPERDSEITPLTLGTFDEKPLFPLVPTKECQKMGNKRGFSDTVDAYSGVKGNWMFNGTPSEPETPKSMTMLPIRSPGTQSSITKEISIKETQATNNNSAPAAKAQVVGWPPIRSFRKNTLATTSKTNDEVDGKPGVGAIFVKVSMDGAPYLRKVDLRTYSKYQELSSALEKMFTCFTIGQCGGSQGGTGRELSESKLRDLLHGSEYVLTYEDKDGDWMLVGDVPWEMFINSCKRLKIMKGSDAIGLAPRVMEKSKNRS